MKLALWTKTSLLEHRMPQCGSSCNCVLRHGWERENTSVNDADATVLDKLCASSGSLLAQCTSCCASEISCAAVTYQNI